MSNIHYTYIYLDSRRPGRWEYKDWVFLYQPFYVGLGMKERMTKHLKKAELNRKGSSKARRMRAIIEETGNDPFYLKLSEGISKGDAVEEEIALIAHFGRLDIGTGILDNQTAGGLGVPKFKYKESTKEKQKLSKLGSNAYNSKCVLQYDLDGNFIKKWDFLKQAADAVGGFPANISAACNGKQKSSYGFIWKYDGTTLYKKREKPRRGLSIFQYSFFGDFLAEYDTRALAASEWGISDGGIWQCLKGNSYHCGGFQWFSEYRGEKIPIAGKQKAPTKKVYQYKNGNFIQEFPSVNDAAESISSAPSCISQACRDPFSLVSNGYQWSLVRYDSLPLLPYRNERPVMQFDKNKEFVAEYSSVNNVDGFSSNSIRPWLKSKEFKFGYYWDYSENHPELSRFTFKPKTISPP